jgi:hypothetical protein
MLVPLTLPTPLLIERAVAPLTLHASVEELPAVIEAGVAVKLLITAGAPGETTPTVALFETPFNVAVTVRDWLLVTVPAAALNAAEDEPAGTLTEAGTLSNKLFDDRPSVTPPAGAEAVRVTVQTLTAPDIMLDGEH